MVTKTKGTLNNETVTLEDTQLVKLNEAVGASHTVDLAEFWNAFYTQ